MPSPAKKHTCPKGKKIFSWGCLNTVYAKMSPTKARGISTHADASKGGGGPIGVV